MECPSQREDLRHLKEKVDCGVDFLVTQMFFDNSALYSFLYRAQQVGITVPVLAGIMPVTNGASLPSPIIKLLARYEDDPASLRQAGIEYACRQLTDLQAHGVEGLHVYTMNKPDVAAGIAENLSKVLGRT